MPSSSKLPCWTGPTGRKQSAGCATWKGGGGGALAGPSNTIAKNFAEGVQTALIDLEARMDQVYIEAAAVVESFGSRVEFHFQILYYQKF